MGNIFVKEVMSKIRTISEYQKLNEKNNEIEKYYVDNGTYKGIEEYLESIKSQNN